MMSKIFFLTILWITKLNIWMIRLFKLGHASNLPGKIALMLNKNFIRFFSFISNKKIILVTGTNGKSTTFGLAAVFLKTSGKTVLYNETGANLRTGIASTFAKNSNLLGRLNIEYILLEIDEATLPLITKDLAPDLIVVTNLFRDQLDRFGELDTTLKLIETGINNCNTTVLLNADDPRVAFINTKNKKYFFGFSEGFVQGNPYSNKGYPYSNQGYPQNGMTWLLDPEEATECPNCNSSLTISNKVIAHLGSYKCNKCRLKKPVLDFEITSFQADNLSTNCDIKYNNQKHNFFLPFIGTFNLYNTLCAIAISNLTANVTDVQIQKGLQLYSTIFGRFEKLSLENKSAWIYLIKNPTGTTEVLKTLSNLENARFLIALNDNLADGRDVSWIWDARFDFLKGHNKNIFVSGKRAYDMALRLKYADIEPSKIVVDENITSAVKEAISNISKSETLYILPTYTVLLEMQRKGISKN